MTAEQLYSAEAESEIDFQRQIDNVFHEMLGVDDQLDAVIESRTRRIKELVNTRSITKLQGRTLALSYYTELQHVFFKDDRGE